MVDPLPKTTAKPTSLLAGEPGVIGNFFNGVGKFSNLAAFPMQFMNLAFMGAGVLSIGKNIPWVGGILGKGSELLAWPATKMQTTRVGDVAGAKTIAAISKPVAAVEKTVGQLMGRDEAGIARGIERADARLEEVHSKFTDKYPGMGDVWKNMHEAAGAVGNPTEMQAALKAAGTAAQAAGVGTQQVSFGKRIINFFSGGTKEERAIAEYERAIQQKMAQHDRQEFLTDPEAVTQRRLSNQSIGAVVGKGFRIADMGIRTYQSGKIASDGFGCVRHIMADVEGKEVTSVSRLKALGTIGNVLIGNGAKYPPIVRQACKAYIRGIFPRMGILLGGMWLQDKVVNKVAERVSNPMAVNMAASMAFEGTQQLNRIFAGQSALLQLYHSLHVAQHNGHPIPALPETAGQASYLSLLLAGSPELRKMGGEYSANARLIAGYYEMHQTPIAEVMQDLNKGEARWMEISQIAQQEFAAAKEQQAKADEQEKLQNTPDWLSRMQLKNPQKTLGADFTTRINAEKLAAAALKQERA